MEKERYTFRLSPETIRQLDELIEKGIIQNRTDGVIKGINMLYEMESWGYHADNLTDALFMLTKSAEFVNDWPGFPRGAKIPFYGIPGVKLVITKLGTKRFEATMGTDDSQIVITYNEERWGEFKECDNEK